MVTEIFNFWQLFLGHTVYDPLLTVCINLNNMPYLKCMVGEWDHLIVPSLLWSLPLTLKFLSLRMFDGLLSCPQTLILSTTNSCPRHSKITRPSGLSEWNGKGRDVKGMSGRGEIEGKKATVVVWEGENAGGDRRDSPTGPYKSDNYLTSVLI